MLSRLSQCASLVFAPKGTAPLKHIEFIGIEPGRALVVLVTMDGSVENRIVSVPKEIEHSSLIEAGNYLTERLQGLTLEQAHELILTEVNKGRSQLGNLAQQVVTTSLALWENDISQDNLIIKGQSNLLRNVNKIEELKRLQALIAELESKEGLLGLLDAVIKGEGIQVFIGAENQSASMDSCSVILKPYRNEHHKVVGAVGVIGPIWLQYSKIIPMVDYTAEVLAEIH